MRVVMFCHSLLSDWNHGNAHFLRGLTTELIARGHQVSVYEPADAWSLQNLLREEGDSALARFAAAYPGLSSERYELSRLDLDRALDGADLVIVHEWNSPELVRRIGERRAAGGRFCLLFHDTHHRSVSEPEAMARYDLSRFDGVLAFGRAIADVYLRRGFARHVWVFHEAADTRVFRPLQAAPIGDVVWIGNWGDEERSAELREFFLDPVRTLGIRACAHGVRYPERARRALQQAGVEYAGWLPNFEAPAVYARFRATLHVPRRPYARALPGVPTIRVFEALACGIPLICAPWDDSEHLFTSGHDFLVARDGEHLTTLLRSVLYDRDMAGELARNGLQTIRARHTCAHRADELLAIQREVCA